MLCGFIHGNLVCLGADDQSPSRCRRRRWRRWLLADILMFGVGIDPAQLQHFKIGVQPGDAVGVDAAQIASGEHVGGLLGVCARHAKVHENLRRNCEDGPQEKENSSVHFAVTAMPKH